MTGGDLSRRASNSRWTLWGGRTDVGQGQGLRRLDLMSTLALTLWLKNVTQHICRAWHQPGCPVACLSRALAMTGGLRGETYGYTRPAGQAHGPTPQARPCDHHRWLDAHARRAHLPRLVHPRRA